MATAVLNRTDETVRNSVLHQLDWEPELNASGIGVSVEDGVVTLTGYIDSYAAKLAAERAAQRVYGVRAVANDLQVKLEDDRTDTDVAHDCLQALRNRVGVPPGPLSVRYGHVVLEGVVEWMFQRIAAEDCVKTIRSVKGSRTTSRFSPPSQPRRSERRSRRRSRVTPRSTHAAFRWKPRPAGSS